MLGHRKTTKRSRHRDAIAMSSKKRKRDAEKIILPNLTDHSDAAAMVNIPPWNMLPDIILQRIFRLLFWKDRAKCLQFVCRRWRDLMPYQDICVNDEEYNYNEWQSFCAWLRSIGAKSLATVGMVEIRISKRRLNTLTPIAEKYLYGAALKVLIVDVVPVGSCFFELVCKGNFPNLTTFAYSDFPRGEIMKYTTHFALAVPQLSYLCCTHWWPATFPSALKTWRWLKGFVTHEEYVNCVLNIPPLDFLELDMIRYKGDNILELPFLPSLTALKLTFCSPMPHFIGTLAKQCPNLKRLSLGYCELRCNISYLWSSLIELSISHCSHVMALLAGCGASNLEKLTVTGPVSGFNDFDIMIVSDKFVRVKELTFDTHLNPSNSEFKRLFATCQNLETVRCHELLPYYDNALFALVTAPHSLVNFIIKGHSDESVVLLDHFLNFLEMKQPPVRKPPINLGRWVCRHFGSNICAACKKTRDDLKKFGYSANLVKRAMISSSPTPSTLSHSSSESS